MTYGDYRSACASSLWGQAYIIANNIEHPDERNIAINDWWRNANLEEVVTHFVWSVYLSNRNETEFLKEVLVNIAKYSVDLDKLNKNTVNKNDTLNLHIDDNFLENNHTIDWKSLYIEWTLVAARSVLPLFEGWAAAYAPEHLYAMRSALDAAQHKDATALPIELLEAMDNARSGLVKQPLTVDDAVRLAAAHGLDEQDAVFRAASDVLRLNNEAIVALDEADEEDETYDADEEYWDNEILSALLCLEYEILRSDAKNIAKDLAYHAANSIYFAVTYCEKNVANLTLASWVANAQSIFDASSELKILERNEVDCRFWRKCCGDKFEINIKKLSQDFSLHVLKTLRARFLAQQ